MDLRKKASVLKPNKFTNALIEYLSNELKTNNVKCRKKVSYIDIKIDNKIDNKYSNLIVDCFDGKIYLRGHNVNDKQILKMRRFHLGERESDALYCAKGAFKQIERYLKKINYNKLEIKTSTIDLRKKLKRTASKVTIDCRTKDNKSIDLRGKVTVAKRGLKDMRLKNKTGKIDLRKKVKVAYGRDYAVTIIDGKVYKGDTHGECVTQLLQEMGIEGIEFYDRIDLRENLGFNFYSQFAAAHVQGDKIYLDKISLENISQEQAVQILKGNFPNYEICDYDSREKLGIYLDRRNRDSAILYFNGEMIEGDDHWTMMEQYILSNGNIKKEDYKSENSYEKALSDEFDSNSYATGNKVDNNIYFEDDFLNNCTTEDIISSGKQYFPNCKIIFHEYDLDSCRDYINEYTTSS